MTIDYRGAIIRSGLSIYDPIAVSDPNLWIPSVQLEIILQDALQGISLYGFPLRTRSKVVKSAVCDALGYPVPASFRKTRPRFSGQQFDTYVQKSNNLQVWNEEVSPSRRYVIIRVDAEQIITKVRVITGEELARWDKTGTLTTKLQARLILGRDKRELITPKDTSVLAPLLGNSPIDLSKKAPTGLPEFGQLLPVAAVFRLLKPLVGLSFDDAGYDQERLRAATLHERICLALGYANYSDDGRFPDIKHQLLEVKLQTSPTIDLGLVSPSSVDPLDIPQTYGNTVRHCDVRYALFYAKTDGRKVTLTHFFLTTGAGFFARFDQFQGNVVNAKLQIRLPESLFDGESERSPN